MYTYRRAERDDIDSLIDLLRELTALEDDFDFDAEKHRAGLELLLELPADKACVLVAQVEGSVVGMCSGQVVVSTAMGGGSVWVEDVVITEEYRGKNVGRGMLDKLRQWAEEVAGVRRMQLWADKNNSGGIRFYNRNGWETANAVVLKNMF